jgi:hypothetical protein
MTAARDFQGNRKRHEPAKNGQRGLAKLPGEEGAFVHAPKDKKVVKKKVVSF